MSRNRVSTVIIIAIMMVWSPAGAEIHLTGNVSGLLQAVHNPYYVDGNIVVPVNYTLTLEPGVEMRISGNYRIDVNGTLLAVGTEAHPIFITAVAAQPSAWRGVSINATSGSSSIVRYVFLGHAYQGINCDDSDPVIEKCRFYSCDNTAVRFSSSNGFLRDCVITNINGNGVAVTNNSRATIKADTIRGCGNSGVAVAGNGIPIITECWIENTRDHGIALSEAGTSTQITWNIIITPGVRGISVDQSPRVTIKRNVFYQAGSGAGAFIYRSTDVVFVNNTVLASGQHGVQFTNGGGRCENNIIGENGRKGISCQGSNPICDYNDLYSNGEGDYEGVNAGGHDIHDFPLLGDPSTGNFWPRPNSPVIDRGDPALDLDPDGTQADIGALFFNQNHPPQLQDWTPRDTTLQWPGDSLLLFRVDATDPDNHALFYNWYVNGNLEDRRGNVFQRIFNRDATYTVWVVVDDRLWLGTAEHFWMVTVTGSSVKFKPELPEGYTVGPVYPNPFNGRPLVEITIPAPDKALIEIWDVSGRKAADVFNGRWDEGTRRFLLDTDGLPAGEYLLAVKVGGGMALRSFVHLK